MKKIKNSGFSIELDGDDFTVAPSEKLTDQQREFMKTNKAQIMGDDRLQPQRQARDAQHKA